MSNLRKLLIALVSGAALGLALFLPLVTEAHTYLSGDSEACINCHIMRPFYISKQRSMHRNAECSDCHLPHLNFAKFYAYKSRDGMWDAFVYSVKREDYAIMLHKGSKITISDNCIRCHPRAMGYVGMFDKSGRFCGDCHRNVVHAQKGASSFPHAYYPKFKPFISKLKYKAR